MWYEILWTPRYTPAQKNSVFNYFNFFHFVKCYTLDLFIKNFNNDWLNVFCVICHQ